MSNEMKSLHWYRDKTRVDTDHPEKAIYLGGNDTLDYIQYSDGLCYDIVLRGPPEDRFDHLRPANELARTPCDRGKHDFPTTFENYKSSAICSKCGYSADTLRLFCGYEMIQEEVRFTCPECGEIKDGSQEPTTVCYYDEEQRRLCDECVGDEYSLEAQMSVEDLEDYLLVCRGTASSIAGRKFFDPEVAPTCTWVANATAETVGYYFQERSGYDYQQTPQTAHPCPVCGRANTDGITLLSVTSRFGRALATAVDTTPDNLIDQIFGDKAGKVDFTLSDDIQSALIDHYHRLDREEEEYIIPKYREESPSEANIEDR